MLKLINKIKLNTLLGIFFFFGVSQANAEENIKENTETFANVTAVDVSGSTQKYRFSVTIKSPDEGCEQYANWWEVLNEKGELLYRRILAHSHAGEQPFARSGGIVKADDNETLYIRAHMFPSGYGGVVFVGNATDGFKTVDAEDAKKVLKFKIDKPKTTCAF